MQPINVTHNEAEQRFETEVGGHRALLEYRRRGSKLDLVHTEVPDELEGQGIGSALVRAALEYAREHQQQVIPSCPFVAVYIKRHDEYRELVAASAA